MCPHEVQVLEVYSSVTSNTVQPRLKAGNFNVCLNLKCDHLSIWRTVLELIFLFLFPVLATIWEVSKVGRKINLYSVVIHLATFLWHSLIKLRRSDK